MANTKSIPIAARPAYEAVTQLTNSVCQTHLNDEWAALCCELTAALARKRPSPLSRGQIEVWAAAILHALGVVNLLHDRSQTPSMSVAELCAAFGVSQSAVGNRSKHIRDLFKMNQLDPNWTLRSRMDENPLAWLITVNGLVVDARHLPPEMQAEAHRRGLIPYVPTQVKDKN